MFGLYAKLLVEILRTRHDDTVRRGVLRLVAVSLSHLPQPPAMVPYFVGCIRDLPLNFLRAGHEWNSALGVSFSFCNDTSHATPSTIGNARPDPPNAQVDRRSFVENRSNGGSEDITQQGGRLRTTRATSFALDERAVECWWVIQSANDGTRSGSAMAMWWRGRASSSHALKTLMWRLERCAQCTLEK